MLAAGFAYTQDGPADLPAEVDTPEARVAYCYYTFSMRVQDAAQSSNPSRMLALVQNVQDWQNGVERRFSDRQEMSAEIIKAKQIFDRQLETLIAQGGVSASNPQSYLLAQSAGACQNELQQLADYVPPVVPAEEITVVSNTVPAPAVQKPVQVEAQAVQTQAAPSSSPFKKGVFYPGWKGDLMWAGGIKARMSLNSFDEIPTYAQDAAIHVNARSSGNDVRAYCIGHMVEFDRSPDGLTLLLKPAADAGCPDSKTILSLHAAAPDRLRMEVRSNNSVVASGDLWPHNGGKGLVMAVPEVSSEPQEKVVTPSLNAAPAASNNQLLTTADVRKVPEPATQSLTKTGCTVCLPIESAAETTVASPYVPGFFDVPWQGRFHWDWHHVDYMTARAQGKLTRKSGAAGAEKPLLLQLEYDSEYSDVCVGDLRETGRSVQGYIIHFEVEPRAGRSCNPRVTHAYLYPLSYKDNVDATLSLVLYRDSQLISSGLMGPPKDSPVQLRVIPQFALQARDTVEGLKQVAANDLKQKKSEVFQASADYATIKPLYEACMSHEPDIFAVIQREPYCQCVAEKVGIGQQITGVPVQRFANDFASLVARLHGRSNQENKFYYRIGESCRHCSDERYELEPYCSGPDTLLYAATDYEKFIRLLERNAPKIEATDYYKKVFYRTYLQGYSAFCADHIQDPVPFVYTVTETTVGGWDHGNVNVIQRDETLVERRYAEKYGRFYDEINAPSGSVNIGQALSNAAAGATAQGIRRGIRDAQAMLETERTNRTAISAHLQQGCQAKPVREAYARLLNVVD